MARTKQRTRIQDFIVTPGDEVRGEDGASPGSIVVRGGEDPGATASGASAEFRGGDTTAAGQVGGAGTVRGGDAPSGTGGALTARGGDGAAGGNFVVRGGDATSSRGGILSVRGGNGSSDGGDVTVFGGVSSAAVGGDLVMGGGDGPAGGGSATLSGGDGSSGGAVTIAAGVGAAAGGDVSISGGENTGTSGDGGSLTLTGGSASNVGALGDGGSIVMTPGGASGTGSRGSIVLDYATWPSSDGSGGQVLTTNGAGVLSWTTAGGGGGESLAATLLIGNDTGGTPIITADSATATPATLSLTGGSHTGALSGFDGAAVNITAGDSSTGATGNGGAVLIAAGDSVSTSGFGGSASVSAGASSGGQGGSAWVQTNGPLPSFGRAFPEAAMLIGTEDSATTGLGGWILIGRATGSAGSSIELQGGDAAPTSGVSGGGVTISAGDGDGVGNGGSLSLRAGSGDATGVGGGAQLLAGSGGTPGDVTVQAGNAIIPFGSEVPVVGGDVFVTGGAGAFTGAGGDVRLSGGFSTTTTGLIGLDSPTDRDGGGYKFGIITAAGGDGATGSASVTFTTPFPSGPPLVVQVQWVSPGGASTAPPTMLVHSVSTAGFTVAFTAFASTPAYDIHWTARQ